MISWRSLLKQEGSLSITCNICNRNVELSRLIKVLNLTSFLHFFIIIIIFNYYYYIIIIIIILSLFTHSNTVMQY